MKYGALLLLALISHQQSSAQQLNGKWVGNSAKSIFIVNTTEMVLDITLYNDTLITGSSYMLYRNGKYEHHRLNGKFNPADSTAVIVEDSIISYKMGLGIDICPGIYHLALSRNGSKLKWSGTWKDRKPGLFRCPTLKVQFTKNYLPPNATQQYLLRLPDLQQVIKLNSNETNALSIQLVDNGEIDSDTITVYLNDSVIISNLALTGSFQSFRFNLNPAIKYNRLTFFANNEGAIAPNTGYIIIKTAAHTYNFPVSSSFKKMRSLNC